jgi:hypothetical protein
MLWNGVNDSDNSNDSFKSWSKFLILTLKRVVEVQEQHSKDIAALKVKASIWQAIGALALLATGLLVWIVKSKL